MTVCSVLLWFLALKWWLLAERLSTLDDSKSIASKGFLDRGTWGRQGLGNIHAPVYRPCAQVGSPSRHETRTENDEQIVRNRDSRCDQPDQPLNIWHSILNFLRASWLPEAISLIFVHIGPSCRTPFFTAVLLMARKSCTAFLVINSQAIAWSLGSSTSHVQVYKWNYVIQKKNSNASGKYFQSAKSPDDMLPKIKWPTKKSMEVSITAITLRDWRIPKSQWYHEWWPPLLCQVGRLYALEMLCPSTCNLSGTWKVLLKSILPQLGPRKFPQQSSTKSVWKLEISTIFPNLFVDPIWPIRFFGIEGLRNSFQLKQPSGSRGNTRP